MQHYDWTGLDPGAEIFQQLSVLNSLYTVLISPSNQAVPPDEIIEKIITVIHHAQHGDRVSLGFACIEQITYLDSHCREVVGLNELFIQSCFETFQIQSQSRLPCLGAVRNTLWRCSDEVCQNFLCLVPSLVETINLTDEDPELRSLCCTVIQNLTLCGKTRSTLIKNYAIEALAIVIKEQQPLPCGGTLSAASAIANLCADLETEHPVLIEMENSSIFSSVADCFWATLDGTDYPTGTGLLWDKWEISLAVANIARSKRFRKKLRDAGIMPLLIRALEEDSEDIQATSYCLHALWDLAMV
eukprot:c21997_g2_i1.p1 GENE.c21997_g2_i1~~c21997_g2_i1.p1  ORF type:complete len:301 (-),score=86.95 c21997_g2_i1:11-913(-)